MLLPISPHSPWSLFNYAGWDSTKIQSEPILAAPSHPLPNFRTEVDRFAADRGFAKTADGMFAPTGSNSVLSAPLALMDMRRENRASSWFSRANLTWFGALIWAIGVAGLAWRSIIQSISFAYRLRDSNVISNAQVIQVFNECKSLLGIDFRVGLRETGQVKSPAVHGFLRPCLLLPEQMISRFSPRELQFIFLHELAHVKRRDIGNSVFRPTAGIENLQR